MTDDIYFDQNRLAKLNGMLCDEIEALFEHLGIEYSDQGKMLVGPCPVHNGDNKTAFNLYVEELPNGLRGNWKCRSQGCEKKFGNNILALLRGVLEKPWKEVINWACAFLGVEYTSFEGTDASEIEKRRYIFIYMS